MSPDQRLASAMDRADAIVVTHEHADRIGGLLEAPSAATLLCKAWLTPEQVVAVARFARSRSASVQG